MTGHPQAEQIAALPLRRDRRGRLRVLMVTSRDTGRWIVPKGWPMDGKEPWRAAEIEALEEAGAEGSAVPEALGHFHYAKRVSRDQRLTCRVTLFPLVVSRLRRRWKERRDRKRRWFSPKRAARLVAEPELAALLRDIAREAEGNPTLPQVCRKA